VVRPALEVADIFRGHGPAWRQANAGHVSLGQLKVMSAIERCRTAALGGHVVRCPSSPFLFAPFFLFFALHGLCVPKTSSA